MGNLVAIAFGLVAGAADVFCYYLYGGPTLSEVSVPLLLLRYGSAYAGALFVGYLERRVRGQYWVSLIAPPLIVGHTLFLYQLGQMSNLWPPILFVDILLFLPCFPATIFGKKIAAWRFSNSGDV